MVTTTIATLIAVTVVATAALICCCNAAYHKYHKHMVTTLQTMWNSLTIPWHLPDGSWHSCPR